jgi:hypothetical protein
MMRSGDWTQTMGNSGDWRWMTGSNWRRMTAAYWHTVQQRLLATTPITNSAWHTRDIVLIASPWPSPPG